MDAGGAYPPVDQEPARVCAHPPRPTAPGHCLRRGRSLLTYVVFCLLASGCYLANDVHDADEDRCHPVKRHRPVASGALAPRRAMIAAAISIALGLMLATAVNWDTFTVALAYVLLNAAYTLCLRGVVFVEMLAISAAFVLRAIAGATAGGVAPSRTFIAAVACGALFVVVGKRYADLVDPSARRSRAVLARYSRASLRLMMTSCVRRQRWPCMTHGRSHPRRAVLPSRASCRPSR